MRRQVVPKLSRGCVGISVGENIPEARVENPLRRKHRQPIHHFLWDRLGIRVPVLGKNLVIAFSERLVLRVEPQDQQQARRRGVHRHDGQFRSVASQNRDDGIHVSGPCSSVAHAGRLIPIPGEHIIEDDQRLRRAVTLGVDEVPEGELEEMQTVDERKIERTTVGWRQRVRAIEVFVAGGPEKPKITRISAVMLNAGSMATVRARLIARLVPFRTPISRYVSGRSLACT